MGLNVGKDGDSDFSNRSSSPYGTGASISKSNMFGQQGGSELLLGSGGFDPSQPSRPSDVTIGNGYGNSGSESERNPSLAFDLTDFPSLGGASSGVVAVNSTGNISNNGASTQLMFPHPQMMQQSGVGSVAGSGGLGSNGNNVNGKNSNLYRLAMSSSTVQTAGGATSAGAASNFNMTSEDFPALPGAPPPSAGGSNLLGGSGLLDSSSSGGQTQQQRVDGIISVGNNNNAPSSSVGTGVGHGVLSSVPSSQSRGGLTGSNGANNVSSSSNPLGSFGDLEINSTPAPSTSLGTQPGRDTSTGVGGLLGGGNGGGLGAQSAASQLSQQQRHNDNVNNSHAQQRPPASSVVVGQQQPSSATSAAGSALSGDYGLLGLLGVIRMSDADRNALALGSDLTSLGLNLNSSDQLYSTFASPWSESPTTREPHYQLPMCYYMQPPALKTGHLSKFHLETLFYIFYALPKDVLQAYAAQELYSRDWRYHVELKLWFKRAGPADGVPSPNNGGVQYIYFDINSWERRLFTGSMHQNITAGLLSEEDVRVQFPNS